MSLKALGLTRALGEQGTGTGAEINFLMYLVVSRLIHDSAGMSGENDPLCRSHTKTYKPIQNSNEIVSREVRMTASS